MVLGYRKVKGQGKLYYEGMVRLQDLQDDFYYLDEDNYQVIGSRYGQQYKLGDSVRIRVKKIDLSRKQMDFEMLN